MLILSIPEFSAAARLRARLSNASECLPATPASIVSGLYGALGYIIPLGGLAATFWGSVVLVRSTLGVRGQWVSVLVEFWLN
jgi:hypothetical protein